MKCENIQCQLVSLLYDELSPEDKKKILSHLDSCASCHEVYVELQETSGLLKNWEDVNPNLKYVFVTESSSLWIKFRKKLKSLDGWRRFVYGVPAFAAVFFVLLAVLNFRVNYGDGDWEVMFSLFPKRQEVNQEKMVAETLRQKQKETLLLVSKMIEESEYRQQRDNNFKLAKLVQNLEKQRQQDLTMVNQSLQGLQHTTEGRFYQTSHVLNDLIRLTSYNLERK